ncbi:MAG: VCBS repeat-containing protein [Phycisphaerae bacterium]|nr:VCBS repeat-containing protein [Phycisphaerae bacterium]
MNDSSLYGIMSAWYVVLAGVFSVVMVMGHRFIAVASMSVWFCLGLAILVFHESVAWCVPPQESQDPWRVSDPVVRAVNRGVALMERYDYQAAVQVFEQALELAPQSTEVRVNLAIAAFNRSAKGDLKRAEKLLDEALAAEPNNARALYFRGIVHQFSGQAEPAVRCFERVVKLLPHDACTWYLLARGKKHLSRPYRTELERAVKENPALVSAHYDLMLTARQEGDMDTARAYLARFSKLDQSLLSERVVMPQYNQMGPLAVVQPTSTVPKRNVAGGELSAAAPKTVLEASGSMRWRGFDAGEQGTPAGRILVNHGVQLAMADVNGDGCLDMVTTAAVSGQRRMVTLLLGGADGNFADATNSSGLEKVGNAMSCAFGDYDNDTHVDLFVSCAGPNYLFRGRGDGTFEDVTAAAKVAGADVISVSAVFLDADHDADLDIYVCNATGRDGVSPAANQLLNNNLDGTFTDITVDAGVACRAERSIMLAPADLDGDRDTDLVVFNEGAPARVFFNDRFGRYHQAHITEEPIHGNYGGVLQDFNGDGQPDLLVSLGPDGGGRLYLTDGTGTLQPSLQFDGCLRAVTTWGPLSTTRVADVDLDGDLDIAVFGGGGHVLLNDGWGRFVFRKNVWPMLPDGAVIGRELVDLTADGVPDVLQIRGCPTTRVAHRFSGGGHDWSADSRPPRRVAHRFSGGGHERSTDSRPPRLKPWATQSAHASRDTRLELVVTRLTPPANWLAVTPTGDRGDDSRTRSPQSGFGTRMELRCGLHRQVIAYTGLDGGLSQSQRPVIFGLNGASKADYLAFVWPDGVTQAEIDLAAKTHYRIKEMQRRISSCPVLFAWDGERFGFVGDFAGVGGLGYFVARGQYAMPQVLEHVKIEPDQLVARDGFYELRACEPMEEVAYIDRLELVAVDHPKGVWVYPDERLAITGPPPTHRLLCVTEPIFPVRATGPDDADGTKGLEKVDRVYAYQPRPDHRFIGFCQPHTLVLDFAGRLAGLEPGRQIYLFVNGWIEYPYSQTTFAAAQAGVVWEPMKLERQSDDGQWQTVVPDAGAPGGMRRTIAIDLTDKLPTGNCKLRISTNLEIYFDQAFIAADCGTGGVIVHTVPLADAGLRRLGFPMEYSPDGRHPTIYTYDVIAPTSSFKKPAGSYTRYGPVAELLAEFDDRYVILGSGDEIALRFDARRLPSPDDGMVRSFILVSHAYCKDMDLYTAEPDTVKPLPFRDMSAYPYAE